MLKNNLKIAWRNLKRNKGYSIINIGGLALGMAVVIMIGLWVLDEFRFNKYHPKAAQIGQLYNRSLNQDSGEKEAYQSTLYTVGTAVKDNYKDVFEHVLRSDWIQGHTLTYNGKVTNHTGDYIESGILDMLSLEMMQGSHSSLEAPNSIVLSQKAAEAVFGAENPIGKTVKIDNYLDAVVHGVYKDLPNNNRFSNVKFFANWQLFETIEPQRFDRVKTVWDDWSFQLFVQLKEGADLENVNQALASFYSNYAPGDKVDFYKELELELFVHPMENWHLYSDFQNGYATGGRITFVWLFIGIGIFVLLLACINFMNISTARSEKRAKEVGIRKTLGSFRQQLIRQFMMESFLVATLGLIVALFLVAISLPWFNTVADKQMIIPWQSAYFWISLGVFTLIAGLLAGSYPSLYLSSFAPIKVLKGTFRNQASATTSRKALVVFQFVVSIMLAIGTYVVFHQIQHTQDRPIGYDTEGIISLEMNNPDYFGKYNLLRSALKKTGLVQEIGQSSSPLTGIYSNGGGFDWPGKEPGASSNFGLVRVTHDYGKTVGWDFVAGRDFSREYSSDSIASIVINEAAVRYMGLKEPVGTLVTNGDGPPFRIIGVTKNMVMDSPFEPIRQAMFFIDYDRVNFLNIKLNPDAKVVTALTAIEKVLATVVPTAHFDYRFVDQDYEQKFVSEKRLGRLAGIFTLLAIGISCLGLFGLASFIAERRTKEIGVRKVLGASAYDVWKMLSKDFMLLVLIACIIAVPIAYHFMDQWLQGFAYRADISWSIFGFVILGALLLTLATISAQAIRAAHVNPVKSLRTE